MCNGENLFKKKMICNKLPKSRIIMKYINWQLSFVTRWGVVGNLALNVLSPTPLPKTNKQDFSTPVQDCLSAYSVCTVCDNESVTSTRKSIEENNDYFNEN
mmetsp:Transcript_14469/g.27233  ORF Transcript_14469/g.27233 Transcript_14469/m.27233 type:complete len:101 (+) Transcript_14469:1780-2082(+)